MVRQCPKCGNDFSDYSERVYYKSGEWLCDNCDKDKLAKYEKDSSINPQEWKWSPYYGWQKDTTGFNPKEPVEHKVPELIVPSNIDSKTCFFCQVAPQHQGMLICEPCYHKTDERIRMGDRGRNKCPYCEKPSPEKFCLQCMSDPKTVKSVREIMESVEKKN